MSLPGELVLDTNVVLDLFVFRDPCVQPLARAIECGAAVPLTSNACLDELGRVLAYPQFKLDAAVRLQAFGAYRARAKVFEAPAGDACADLPRCSDADDQKFLELAWHARARCLVTRDKALLRLARAVVACGRFVVLHPAAYGRVPAAA